MQLDEHGYPILLANAKFNKTQSNVLGVERGAASGNPLFDPASGRFARKGQAKGPSPLQVVPAGVDPEEWSRRMDAVREAAREFDIQSVQDIQDFLQGKTVRPLDPSELQAFLDDVHRQRLSDLVDTLDHSLRRSISERMRSRRTVRVVPPRGYLRRTLANLSDSDITSLHTRLLARGFTSDELGQFLINRFPEPRRERLNTLVGTESSKTSGMPNSGSGS